MKRNLGNFTRGSQILNHNSLMFASGFRVPVIVALIVLCWTAWWEVSRTLSDHEQYLVWMRFYGFVYQFMAFDPAKQVALKTMHGGHIDFAISYLIDFPTVVDAWDKLLAALRAALLIALVLLAPLFAFYYWFSERFGGRSKERKHERGAMLVTRDELAGELATHNSRERSTEMKRTLGFWWWLARRDELADVGTYCPAKLAGLPFPWRLEASHAMLIGTTGTGKTVALRALIADARARNQRAVVFDLTGAFIEAFYEPKRDIILNPLDARCPQWSVFEDCHDEAEFSAAAEALVPHDGGGTEQFWVLAARLLFVEMCLRLKRDGKGSNAALAEELMTADLAKVHKLMRGTVADPLTAPEAARMAESIRAVFNANAKALKLLPTDGPNFSVRDWVRADARDGAILFISARYIDMSIASQLLTVWMDTAMNTLMAMERSQELRLWFLLDELGALHRLPALEKGLQTARNFGGAIVTGIHAFAKLKEVYGENMAMTLSSLARTKLILATADRETATWCSDFIGHRQVRDMDEGLSFGYNSARDAVSLTPRRHVEPLLLPDQLMNLPRLSGYIKFPDGFPAAPVTLAYRDWPKRQEGFIKRAHDRMPGATLVTPGEGGDAVQPGDAASAPASNDDGAGRPWRAESSSKRRVDKRGPAAPAGPSDGIADRTTHPNSPQLSLKIDPPMGQIPAGAKTGSVSDPGPTSSSPIAALRTGESSDVAPDTPVARSDLPPSRQPGNVDPDRATKPVGPVTPDIERSPLGGDTGAEPPREVGDYDVEL